MKMKMLQNTNTLILLLPLPAIILPLLLRLIVGTCAEEEEGGEDEVVISEEMSAAIASIAATVVPVVKEYFTSEKWNGDGLVLNRVETLCDLFGHRQAGSANLEAAIDWQVARLEEEGFEVRTVDAMIPRWIRGVEQATLMKPLIGNATTPLSMIGLGFSGNTGPPGSFIEAELIVFNSLDEIKSLSGEETNAIIGKIVLINEHYEGYGNTVGTRYKAPKVVKDAGGAACLIRTVGPFGIRSPHTGTTDRGVNLPSAALAIEDANRLVRIYNRSVETGSEAPIVRLVMDGHVDEGDVLSRNVVADYVGASKPDEYVLLSGHLDSWDVGCGAMDDAAGAYIGWTAISALKALGLRPARTIRVAFWTAEETGAQGSQTFWERNLDYGLLDKYSIALESDAGTFETSGISFSGNKEANAIVKEIVGALGMDMRSSIHAGGEDVDWARNFGGIPTGSIIQEPMREFIPVAGEGNSTVGHFQGDYFFYHHSQGDMPDILDSKQLDRASMLWALFAYIVADLPTLLPRIDISYVQQLCLIPGSDGAVDTVCLIREISKIVDEEHIQTYVTSHTL